jgi:hypothetical protein
MCRANTTSGVKGISGKILLKWIIKIAYEGVKWIAFPV